MIERQVIVTWFTPEEKLPEEGMLVVLSVSGHIGDNIELDHTLKIGSYYEDGLGWDFEGVDEEREDIDITVHAWADLSPYGFKEVNNGR